MHHYWLFIECLRALYGLLNDAGSVQPCFPLLYSKQCHLHPFSVWIQFEDGVQAMQLFIQVVRVRTQPRSMMDIGTASPTLEHKSRPPSSFGSRPAIGQAVLLDPAAGTRFSYRPL